MLSTEEEESLCDAQAIIYERINHLKSRSKKALPTVIRNALTALNSENDGLEDYRAFLNPLLGDDGKDVQPVKILISEL